MEMIREESNVRDRPIYLQVGDRNDASNSFWYVIKDKDDDGIEEQIEEEEEEEEEEEDEEEEEEEEEEIHLKKKTRKLYQYIIYSDDEEEIRLKKKRTQIQDDKKKGKHIYDIEPSKTDKIRNLPLPPLNSSYKAKLVVFNSRIYLFGGSGGKDPWVEHSRKVIYFDLKYPKKVWLNGPTLNEPGLTLSVAALQNSFIAVGNKKHVEPFTEFLDDSLNGEWRPGPPIPEPERSQIDDARLLAVTDTKVYIHGVGNHYRMGLSFDLLNSEWNIFDRSFHGTWSPGVVLEFCSKSYLFSFGIHGLAYRQKSTTPMIHSQQLWVYDLSNCTWLPFQVLGLPDNGKVLPDPKLNRCACTYLLQMNQRNKLALVWSKPHCTYTADTEIHCTKFTIDCVTASDYQHPIFTAIYVSYGSYRLRGQGPLYNCAASLIGKDERSYGRADRKLRKRTWKCTRKVTWNSTGKEQQI